MDSLQHAGYRIVVQIAISGIAFGLVRSMWGFLRGSVRAALSVALATGALELAFALVYVASHRVVASCIVAHFLMNLFRPNQA